MIGYRDATPGDAATVAALFRGAFTDTFGGLYRADDLAAFLANHDAGAYAAEIADPAFAVRLAEDDGVGVAYAKLGPPSLPYAPRGPSLELRQIYVATSHQGRAIGPALTGWAIAEARRRGAADLYLSVFVENHRARRLYERLGFERIGAYAFMVGAHADEDDLMRLAL